MTNALSQPLPTVEPGAFLTLHYRLGGPAGTVIDTFVGQPATLSLGTGVLAPALEQCLMGLPEGARATFDLPAGLAFGQRNPDMVQWLARQALDALGDPQAQYAAGEVIDLPTPDGQGRFAALVQAVRDDGALKLDFNHPLAGQPVRFEVEIIGVL